MLFSVFLVIIIFIIYPVNTNPIFLISFIGSLLFSIQLAAQENPQLDAPKNIENTGTNDAEGVEVNFLFTYYEQDGNHSAVTGGTGTEELQDIASKIIVNIPLDSVTLLAINTGLSHYSSASTDKIDFRVSSASSDDFHAYFNVGFTKEIPDKHSSYGFYFGGSIESDYISTSLGGQWSKSSADENRNIQLTATAFFDRIALYLPVELRRNADALPDIDQRQTYQLSAIYSHVLNQRIQASLLGEVIYQRGLLSTPFHRVYFFNDESLKNEKLPANRFKIPVGIRLNYFMTDFLLLRSFYRYYYDNFGIHAHTANLEAPLKISHFITLYPFYRYHNQTAARYFRPYQSHNINEDYYTSDYDLSAFHSHYAGMGIRYAPLWGIGRFQLPWTKNLTLFKSIELRYGNYWRSDGLNAFMLSLDLGFTTQ